MFFVFPSRRLVALVLLELVAKATLVVALLSVSIAFAMGAWR